MKNNIVDAIIEIPLNTKNKFEIDETTGKIRLDRVLYSAMNYPVEYGYIENTLALDGDPLDILLVSSAPTFPGCIVEARVIGYLEVIDNGHEDYKIISVVNVDPRYNEINTLNDMPKFILEEIKDFFSPTFIMIVGQGRLQYESRLKIEIRCSAKDLFKHFVMTEWEI